jgi:hypothetical protein
MKKLFLIGLAILSSTLIVACDKGSSGSSNNNVNQCAYYNNGNCYDNNGNVIPGGNYGPINFYDYNYYAGNGWGQGNLQITDTAVFKEFLKSGMGVCDRGSWFNYGVDNCDNWTSNSYVTLNIAAAATTSSTANVSIKVQHTSGVLQGGFSGGVMTPIPYLNPLTIPNGAVSVVNNSQGFEIRKTLYLGLVQLIVRQGKLNDTSFSYELAFGNKNTGNASKVFATGLLTRAPY